MRDSVTAPRGSGGPKTAASAGLKSAQAKKFTAKPTVARANMSPGLAWRGAATAPGAAGVRMEPAFGPNLSELNSYSSLVSARYGTDTHR